MKFLDNTGLAYFWNKIKAWVITVIPDDLADLNDDATHRLVTDTEKTTWSGKQDVLVSGTNIKTVNNESLLGSGNITIQSEGTITFRQW